MNIAQACALPVVLYLATTIPGRWNVVKEQVVPQYLNGGGEQKNNLQQWDGTI